MMRSMFSGVSGLRVHQTKMDVIANNISNVNTTGFKSSRVTFNEVFSQTLAGGSAPNNTTLRGGTNPMQIGLGASVASIDKIMTTGAMQRTDNPYDVMITGGGFFIVGDVSGTYFTRAGALNKDVDGNIVTASGMKVMGWDVEPDTENIGEYRVVRDKVKPLTITGDKQYSVPQATGNIAFSGNLNADTNKVHTGTISFYDSVGNRYTSNYEMRYVEPNKTDPTPAGYWTFALVKDVKGNDAYLDGDPKKGINLEVGTKWIPPVLDQNGVVTTPGKWETEGLTAKVEFTTGGLLKKVSTATGGLFEANVDGTGIGINLDAINKKVAAGEVPGVVPTSQFGSLTSFAAGPLAGISINFTDVTQFGSEQANAKADKYDGNAPGTLSGFQIGADGKITGRYTNGLTRLLGQIPVAVFKNPAGLEKVGDSLFVATANSGEFDGIGQDVQADGGKMSAGVLEMSNVDLSQEFTEMITTQRGFQANSRIITTSDEMLSELVNLKR